jgi:hydroxyethylthiazole kinase-like uncharacterized protein yjeF
MQSENSSPYNWNCLYTVEQIRQIERVAQNQIGTYQLMRSAALAALQFSNSILIDHAHASILMLAGPGDNGGDALELAHLFSQQGHKVSVVLCGVPEHFSSASQLCHLNARNSSVKFIPRDKLDTVATTHWDILVDGLFGVGLNRTIEGNELDWVHRFNHLSKERSIPILSLDIPSGIHADTGFILGEESIRATHTISFIANKVGLHMNHGRDCVGELHISDLQLPHSIYASCKASANLLQAQNVNQFLKRRSHASNKGTFGKVFILGGAKGMLGAPLLSAKTALMSGAGRIYLAQLGSNKSFFEVQPELMSLDVHHLKLDDGVCLIGPGLGNSSFACTLIEQALLESPSLVIDADALNCISEYTHLQSHLEQRKLRNQSSLLTPHPLEAARLLNCNVNEIQTNRISSCQELSQRYSCTTILKGSGSIIHTKQESTWINSTGNPSLASAGTGDVLAGLCAALLAQNLSPHQAAMMACYVHGRAADLLVEQGHGPIGLTASELIPQIRHLINQLSS